MSRGRRFAWQVALLPLLAGIAYASTDAFTLVVAAAATLGWGVSVVVALILVGLARAAERDAAKPGGVPVPETLVESADNAVTQALIATGVAVAAILAAARVLGLLPPVGPLLLAMLGWALVLVGVPSASWLGTLRRVWLPMLGRGPR